MPEKTTKWICVADTLGYRNETGTVQYVRRGAEIELPELEAQRLLAAANRAVGAFPVIARPGSKAAELLGEEGIPANVSPAEGRARLAEAFRPEPPPAA
jgi:hypothetical protein